MQHVFHVMKINHTLNNIIDNLQLLLFGKFNFFYVQLVVKTPILHELRD